MRHMKKAFITGITGQDGSYLAEFLLAKNYEVHAILRRSSVFTTQRIDHLMGHPNLKTYHGDLCDSSNLHTLLAKVEPDEVYNLGAQSHVAVSFEVPEYTAEVDAVGAIRLLDAIKDLGQKPRFYQASTSELFGGLPETAPQSENTPFYPKSPYGVAKLYAYWVTVNYRESYNYVECMWLMLQQEKAEDYVIATGETYTVREFTEIAFESVGIRLRWEGAGVDEKGIDAKTGKVYVKIDKGYFRPSEVELLWGNPAKAKKKLGWTPKTNLRQLIEIMVNYDLKYDTYGGEEN